MSTKTDLIKNLANTKTKAYIESSMSEEDRNAVWAIWREKGNITWFEAWALWLLSLK